MQGWIKLYRKLTEWEWYSCPATKDVFIDLLLHARREPGKWQGQDVPVGGCVTSIQKIADRCGLSIRQTRTALENLQKTGEIDKQSTNRNTTLIVLNFERYQELADCDEADNRQSNDNQTTNNRQSNDNQTTTNKKEKNIENIENERKREYNARTRTQNSHSKSSYGEFKKVWLTDEEYKRLTAEHSNSEQLIARLDKYKAKTGRHYESDYAAILDWVVKAVKEDEAKKPPIDETYNIDEINRKAMLNDEYDI